MRSGIEIDATMLLAMVEEAQELSLRFHKEHRVPRGLANLWNEGIVGWLRRNIFRMATPSPDELRRIYGVQDLTEVSEFNNGRAFSEHIELARIWSPFDTEETFLSQMKYLADNGDKFKSKVFVTSEDLSKLETIRLYKGLLK